MLNLFRRKPTQPTQVEIRNFPITHKITPFTFLGYDFMPTQILCVSGVLTEKASGEGEEAKYRHTFRVFMGNQFSIAFHEADEELTKKKRELFMQAWIAAL